VTLGLMSSNTGIGRGTGGERTYSSGEVVEAVSTVGSSTTLESVDCVASSTISRIIS
jgi:hypothetical protein